MKKVLVLTVLMFLNSVAMAFALSSQDKDLKVPAGYCLWREVSSGMNHVLHTSGSQADDDIRLGAAEHNNPSG